MIDRVLRIAKGFRQAEHLDRQDVASQSFEERISAVELLRRERFGSTDPAGEAFDHASRSSYAPRKMRSRTTSATRLTTKGQVVIPKSIRGALGWRSGTRLRVIADGNVVTLTPAQRSAGAAWLSEVAGCVHEGDPVGDLEAEHIREVQADARRRT